MLQSCRYAARLQKISSVKVASSLFVQPKRCVSAGAAESYLNGTSGAYVEEMFESWKVDPTSVHKSWDVFFRNTEQGAVPGEAYQSPPEIYGHPVKYVTEITSPTALQPAAAISLDSPEVESIVSDQLALAGLIRAYQTRGHNLAELDPLGILDADLDSRTPPELTLEFWGLGEKDMDKVFQLPKTTYIGGSDVKLTLREIHDRLQKVYCQNFGSEFMFLDSINKSNWIKRHFEMPGAMHQTAEDKKITLSRLSRSDQFEQFLAKKWSSEKRFGVEGCEVLVPALKKIIDVSSENGVDDIIMGMPHRGRLNVLANVCRMPLKKLFSLFNPDIEYSDKQSSGDVKYHLGMSHERLNRKTNKLVKLSVCANPSHLEAVDPVVQGSARARQFYRGDNDGKQVMSILLHGDAAFSGQGVVFETFHLSELPMYTTHGTIHVVVNNQIGFTTDPRMSRSSPYCTDVAKVVQCPIFHVNADDPDAVMHVCKVAAEYRAEFGKDVVIDLVCYRKNGHNEGDNPDFTQPIMYQAIRKQKPAVTLYAEKLMAEGVVTQEEYDAVIHKYEAVLEEEFEDARVNPQIKIADWLNSKWGDFFKKDDRLGKLHPTGTDMATIMEIGSRISTPPKDLEIHTGLKRVLKLRGKMLEQGMADWAIGESLAFATLLKEGIHVRLSGQDVERGTFSHRHHVLHDQIVDKKRVNVLADIFENQAEYSLCNSSLSEYAVLGFELGYSMANPYSLVIWEGQFGDFMNTAQCIIDQFISTGEDKWVRQSGLVMLLPHGMEGMGPEHSSARPERFLQMSNEDPETYPDYPAEDFELHQSYDTNWFICNITTPANFFHLLRRQVYLEFRKPLVVLTPKKLLRYEDARSPLTEMAEGTSFQRVLPDKGACSVQPDAVKKLIMCTGKVYYDLVNEREKLGLNDQIAITRIEQVSPFPFDLVQAELGKYPNADISWVQEEHKNHGYWDYVQARIETACKDDRRASYVGRATSSSPATGNKKTHVTEQTKLMKDAMHIV